MYRVVDCNALHFIFYSNFSFLYGSSVIDLHGFIIQRSVRSIRVLFTFHLQKAIYYLTRLFIKVSE